MDLKGVWCVQLEPLQMNKMVLALPFYIYGSNHGYSSKIVHLSEINGNNVCHSVSPIILLMFTRGNSRVTLSSNAPSMRSALNNEVLLSLNPQRYSCWKCHIPRAFFSCSRNSGVIRGHFVAGISILSHASTSPLT